MTQTMLEPQAIRDAVMLACRAPSLHNSQPWHWVAERGQLHLFADPKAVVQTIDRSGREMILSCGAMLDHLRVAMAVAGWDTAVNRFPDSHGADHLATLEFSPLGSDSDADRQRAGAILRRRTDRLPFAAPRRWDALERQLRSQIDQDTVMLGVIPEDARQQLGEASRLTEAIRHNDPSYQSELRWWTSPFDLDQGVPPSARVSASKPAVSTWHEPSRQPAMNTDARRSTSTTPRSWSCPRATTPARRFCAAAKCYPRCCSNAQSPGWRHAASPT